MADQAPPAPAPPAAPPASPPPAPPAAAAPVDQRVPYDRFAEVNDRAKAAEAEAAELRKWKDEQEQKGLSELEKIRKQQQAAEQRAVEAEGKLIQAERSTFIRSAAQAARFMDPEDAVAFLGGRLAEFDTAEKAAKAVADLATAKPHLLSPTSGWDGGARSPTGGGDIAGAQFLKQIQTATDEAGWQSIPLDR